MLSLVARRADWRRICKELRIRGAEAGEHAIGGAVSAETGVMSLGTPGAKIDVHIDRSAGYIHHHTVENCYRAGSDDVRDFRADGAVGEKADHPVAGRGVKFQDRVRAYRPVADGEDAIVAESGDLNDVAACVDLVEADCAKITGVANVDSSMICF